MKTAFDSINGTISGIDEKAGELIIRAPYSDWFTLMKRNYKECTVVLKDSRRLSDQQRKCCYALLGEIADYAGMSVSTAKDALKLKFLSENLQETGDNIFSLSNAPMSLVCAFQRFLVRMIIEYDIPCKKPLLNYVDDIDDYLYSCLINKRCAVCGQPSELHHCLGSRVGMGRNRKTIVHEGLEVLPLCRIHHGEAHVKPVEEWKRDYHIDHGIKLDKSLCKIYRLKENIELESERQFEDANRG